MLSQRLRKRLENRRERGLLRTRRIGSGGANEAHPGMVDFASNDYLGLASSDSLRKRFQEHVATVTMGSTGSALLSGWSQKSEEMEQKLAEIYAGEAGLLVHSGYMANLILFSCLPSQGDYVLLHKDAVHASVHDGLKLHQARYQQTAAKVAYFETAEEVRDVACSGTVWVVLEALTGMDGEIQTSLLRALARVRTSMANLELIVDEAHSTGLFGPSGRGLVVELGLESQCSARVHTFGKALGCQGAVVLCPKIMRDYLINYGRPYIYSTYPSGPMLALIEAAHEEMDASWDCRIRQLRLVVRRFRSQVKQDKYLRRLLVPKASNACISPIQGLLCPGGNTQATLLARTLSDNGFNTFPIRSPTVKPGSERIRVCLHSFNAAADVDRFVAVLSSCLGQLQPSL